jgi:NitT/TauT family transport system substrate-binding protein
VGFFRVEQARVCKRFGGAFTVAALMSATLVLAEMSATPAIAQDKAANTTLRIQEYPGSIVSLHGWLLQDAGFCATRHLTCVSTAIPSGPLGLQALATGSIEVSFASTDVIMQSASRGNDVQLVVGHSPNNIYQLDVRGDVPLPDLAAGYPAVMKDLVGLKAGVTARGAAVEIQMRALLAGAGLSPDAMTYVAVGSPGTAYPSMMAKQIDAAVMFEPFHTLCRVQKTCNNAVNLAKGEGPPELAALNGGFETFAMRRDYIKANPAVVQAFIEAMTEAIAWMQKPENLDKVVAITRKHMSLGDIPNADATLVELVKSQVGTYGPKIDRKSVTAFSDFLIKNKLIDQPVSAASFVYEKAP